MSHSRAITNRKANSEKSVQKYTLTSHADWINSIVDHHRVLAASSAVKFNLETPIFRPLLLRTGRMTACETETAAVPLRFRCTCQKSPWRLAVITFLLVSDHNSEMPNIPDRRSRNMYKKLAHVSCIKFR